MTKVRAPLSIDDALARIAGQVPGGWKAMAQELGRPERTVRKWGDADEAEHINWPSMIALDLFFQANGGRGFPIYDTYGLALGAATSARFTDRFELLRDTIRIVKETGEAEEALLRLVLPDSTEADRQNAVRELLEAHREIEAILPLLAGQAQPP